MVFRKISADIKQRALQLLRDGWRLSDVVDALGVSSKSIERWADNYAREGCVNPSSPLRGHPRVLDSAALDDLQELVDENPSLYLDEIAEWLALFHETRISISALHNTLRDLGYTVKVLKRTAAQRDEEDRAAWRQSMLTTFSRDQLVFMDESSKDGRTLVRLFGRARIGWRAVEVVDHDRGTRWSIVPALSLKGYIALRVVAGSVDGTEFFDFVVHDVLPKMNRYPLPQSVLVMDNCSTHKSTALRDAVEAAGCILLFLPAYSPDLNPIEESFNVVKAALRRDWRRLEDSDTPLVDLLHVCMNAVTPQKADQWFRDCGYID